MMSSFDKFMDDLEKRRIAKAKREEAQKAADDAHGIRNRVRLYSEKWQNSVRYSWRKK